MGKILIIACMGALALAKPSTRGEWCGPVDSYFSKMVPDAAPMPSFNGTPMCKEKPTMGPSCQKHDVCYDTCGTTQKQCDDEFLLDLLKRCDTQKQDGFLCNTYCHGLAHLYHQAVSMFGADPFAKAQAKFGCKKNQ